MHASALLLSALGAASVLAAPAWPQLNTKGDSQAGLDAVSEYFNQLAQMVRQSKALTTPPSCDISKAVLPQQPPSPSSLPGPSPGFKLKHVAIGRGTQNYTCADESAAPTPAGAVAALFDASCLATGGQPAPLFETLTRASLHFSVTSPDTWLTTTHLLAPSQLSPTGRHYFRDATTPFFDLGDGVGHIPSAKAGAEPAPKTAAKGPGGEAAVPWLKLTAKDGATGGLKEVFRVETVGGSAPASCKGLPASFELQYAAQYWFFEGTTQ